MVTKILNILETKNSRNFLLNQVRIASCVATIPLAEKLYPTFMLNAKPQERGEWTKFLPHMLRAVDFFFRVLSPIFVGNVFHYFSHLVPKAPPR